MAFDTFTPRLKQVAESGRKYFTNHFGNNGMKIGEEIHPDIHWKPTFHVKRNRNLIVAAEVDDKLYPGILRMAAHDINHFDFPISVYLICPLEFFQADPGQKNIKELRKHGFGIITVDGDAVAQVQNHCIPLAQHISDEEIESHLRDEDDGLKLTPNLKVAFRTLHQTFLVNETQGLQGAGTLIESIVNELAEASVARGLVAPSILTKLAAADKIDDLYILPRFQNYRAALGGTRGFVKTFRNIASHPTPTPKKAVEKIRKCKAGFFEAIREAKNLCKMARTEKFRLNINL